MRPRKKVISWEKGGGIGIGIFTRQHTSGCVLLLVTFKFSPRKKFLLPRGKSGSAEKKCSHLLRKRLLDVGIRGNMWRVIKNLYDVVESSVLVEDGVVPGGGRETRMHPLPHPLRDLYRWYSESY